MLVLEIALPEIRTFYRPPGAGQNVGGYLGRIFPGGSSVGIGYERLLALGTGFHGVLGDERAKRNRGVEPANETEDDRRLGELRWALFMYRVGACTEGEVLLHALL